MTETPPPKLAALLLAAGGSSRLGQPKQLVILEGVTLVRRAATMLLGLGIDPVVVVTGCCEDEITRELNDLPLTLVNNNDWEQGMGRSIACGAEILPESVDGVLVMLCDQWLLNKPGLASMIAIWKSDISRIVLSEWTDGNSSVTGPPVIFTGTLLHELKFVHGNSGAKQVVDRHRDIVRRVELQNAKFDLDSPEDLACLQDPEKAG